MATTTTTKAGLEALPLPEGITSHYIDCTATTGLTIHILSAGHDLGQRPNQARKPLILLHHGYPELAYSWRRVMPLLAQSKGPHGEGYHVVALDQRGFGRTTGWQQDAKSFEQVDMSKFSVTNLVRDSVALVFALGYSEVKCIAGHDFGAVSASYCAVARPDVFRRVVTMSHPFKGPPGMPFGYAVGHDAGDGHAGELLPSDEMDEALARLEPARRHYKSYNASPQGVRDWDAPEQGLAAFLRGYFHLKSASWAPNRAASRLAGWTAEQLARLPEYYVMRLELSMPQSVARCMAGEDEAATKAWMPDADLAVYTGEWERTGFIGALTWYRAMKEAGSLRDQRLFAGRKIDVPSYFISGALDWGNYQQPGALEGQAAAGRHFRGIKLIEGASHWVQQEQPEPVVRALLQFLDDEEEQQ